MGGATRAHNVVVFNLVTELGQRLRGGPCQGFPSDLRVRLGDGGRYGYPDLTVACGNEEFLPGADLDTLLNPTVVFEVHSPPTEGYDRGSKFDAYRAIPSLRAYVLVGTSGPRVEVFTRMEQETWRFTAAHGTDAVLPLDALGLNLPLAEAYRNAAWPDPPGPMPHPVGNPYGGPGA